MIKYLKDEAGYSLVEVMVSIMILTIAIIPMVGMFDAGLRAATLGGNYDQARALAKKQMEQAQSLPYGTVKTSFPSSPEPFNSSGLSETLNRTDAQFSGFSYEISKQYVNGPAAGGTTFGNPATDQGLMRITVIVRWDGTKSYRITSLKVR